MENSIKRNKKKKVKVSKKMPFCPTSQKFWPKYNFGIFAPKHADSIFSGPRKEGKILSKKKIPKNFVCKCR